MGNLDHGPALVDRCYGHENPDFNYPARFRDMVPKTIKMRLDVRSDRFAPQRLEVERGQIYPAWTNRHGAVSAILPNGEKLGLYRHEFEVIEWLSPTKQKQGTVDG